MFWAIRFVDIYNFFSMHSHLPSVNKTFSPWFKTTQQTNETKIKTRIYFVVEQVVRKMKIHQGNVNTVKTSKHLV